MFRVQCSLGSHVLVEPSLCLVRDTQPGGSLRLLSFVRTALALITVATAALAPNQANSKTVTDWVVVSVIAGPAGVSGATVSIRFRGRTDPAKMAAFGVARGSISGWGAEVIPSGENGMNLRTSRQFRGVRVEVLPASSSHDGESIFSFELEPLMPRQYLRVAAFVTGIVEPTARATWRIRKGSANVAVNSGRGSRAISMSEMTGTGIALGSTAVADVSKQEHVRTGIVGAFADCGRCSGSWHTPDKRTGSFDFLTSSICVPAMPHPVSCSAYHPNFHGAHGLWKFEWKSLNAPPGTDRPVLAYFPVGSLATPPLTGKADWCDGSMVGEATARCTYFYAGHRVTAAIHSPYDPHAALSTMTVRVRWGSRILASCSNPPGEPYCGVSASPLRVPVGARLTCEAHGNLISTFACS